MTSSATRSGRAEDPAVRWQHISTGICRRSASLRDQLQHIGTGVYVESTSPAPSSNTSVAPRYEEVEFSADGGPTLRGRVWSEGPIGVVLAHGFSPDSGQDDWIGFADNELRRRSSSSREGTTCKCRDRRR